MDEKQMMRKLNDKYPNIVRQIYKFSNDKKIFSVDDAFTLYNALNYCDNNKINITSIEELFRRIKFADSHLSDIAIIVRSGKTINDIYESNIDICKTADKIYRKIKEKELMKEEIKLISGIKSITNTDIEEKKYSIEELKQFLDFFRKFPDAQVLYDDFNLEKMNLIIKTPRKKDVIYDLLKYNIDLDLIKETIKLNITQKDINTLFSNISEHYNDYLNLFNILNKTLEINQSNNIAKLVNKLNFGSIELITKNNIINLEQISEILKGQKNGLSKSKIRIFALPHFNQKQMEQIRLALEHGVSNKKILIIANPKNDAEKMGFLRKNMECKIDGIDIENESLDVLKKNFEQYIKNIKLDDILSDKISIPQEDKAVFLKENNKNILNEILFAYQSGVLNEFKHFLNKGFSGFQLQEIRRALEHNLTNSDISLMLTVNNHEDIQKIRKILEAKNLIEDEKSIKFLNSVIDGYKNNTYDFKSFITIANEEIIDKLGECYDLNTPEKIYTEKEMNKKQKAFFSDMLTEYKPEELELFKKCKSSIQMEQVEDGLKRKLPLDLIEKYIGFNRDKMLEIKLSILGLLVTLKSKNYSNDEAYQIIKNSIHLVANENLTVSDMRKIREDYVKGSSEVDIMTKYGHLYSRKENTQESKYNEIIR